MKHAYLILAHHQFGLLKKIVELLDDYRHDLYIHIDRKAGKIDYNDLKSVVRYSKVYFSKRIPVSWGNFNMVKAEIALLEMALGNGKYSYFHLISGMDLPLKSTDEIYSFFEKNKGTEYVHFCTDNVAQNNKDILRRITFYYPFQGDYRSSAMLKKLYMFSLWIQEKLKVDRINNTDIIIGYGAQWFSITDNLANYIVHNKEFINKIFRMSLCSDELFLQTLVINSEFKNHLAQLDLKQSDYHALMRLIDWERGKPYIYRTCDYNLLSSTDCLFARKFDENTDAEIVDAIYNDLMKEKNH